MAEQAVAEKGFVVSADGTKLAYRAWPVRDAEITFAVVHGLGEHSRRYERFAQGMAKHRMGTLALDFRGHGDSPGQRGHVDSWSQWTDDTSAFVRHVEGLVSGEVVPLGHSWGGAALLSTVLAGKLSRSRRFIVSSPALRLKVVVPSWTLTVAKLASVVAPRLAMDNGVDSATISRIPEVVEAYRTDPLVHSKISSRMYIEWQRAADYILARANDIKIPFLILAGSSDRLVDPEGSRALHDKAPAMGELRMLEGRYHEPFNDRDNEEVFAMISDWLSK